MNHYPHHIGDFDKATRHLNRLERSIYRDLLDVYYETELPLTLEIDKLKRKILATTEQESTAVEQVLNEFFLETPNGWFHSRCDVEILKFQDNTTQKALAGKASAAAKAARKQQALNGRLTDVERHLNGTSTNQNLEPRTNNQEPKKKAQAPTASPFVLPEWINQSHWDTWHRGTKRKAASNAQKQLAVDKLTRWRNNGIDHAKALENAAEGNWQGLHEPSGKQNPYVPPSPAATTPSRESVDPRMKKAIEESMKTFKPVTEIYARLCQ